MRFYLYLLILCLLSSILPFPWRALVLLLMGFFFCIFIVTHTENKRLAFWQAVLMLALLLLFLILGWILHVSLGV
jgi:hypothetical protein